MSNRPQAAPKAIQNVFVLLLLAIFACLSTFLVMMGAQVYRATVVHSERNNNARIMTSVIRSAIWADDGGEVSIEEYDQLGLKVLAIRNDYGDGDIYYRRLYCRDGYLWESYTHADRGFNGESGDTLCELELFEPSIDEEGRVLTFHLRAPDGTEDTVQAYLRAGGAGK